MEKISSIQFEHLIEGAEVIEKDGFGLKVLDTHQGEMIKIFRRKRLFSTALLKPYAVRFADNAKQLASLDIPTIKVKKLLWCRDIQRHIVVYKRLDGKLLRDMLSQSTDVAENTFEKFGAFMATLHDKGVYFRSAHLKNILVLPNGELGLIDISDMQIKRCSLKMGLRLRNFVHILRYQEDKNLMKHHIDDFMSGYVSASQIDDAKIKQTILSIIN